MLSTSLIACEGPGFPAQRQLNEILANLAIQVVDRFPSVDSYLKAGEAPDATARRLLIVYIPDANHLSELGKLRDGYLAWPIICLLPSIQDAGLVVMAERYGATQVVGMPLDADDFELAIRRISHTLPEVAAEKPKLVLISGASGGCGASLIALNFASWVAESLGDRTVLVELTDRPGSFATFLDRRPEMTVEGLLERAESVDRYMVDNVALRVGKHLQVLAAEYRPVLSIPVTAAAAEKLIDVLLGLARVVIVDIPASWHPAFLHLADRADAICLVGQQNLISMYRTRVMLDLLKERHGINGEIIIVVNRYSENVAGLDLERLKKLLGSVDFITLPDDPETALLAVNQGKLLAEVNPKSPLAVALENGARRFVSRAIDTTTVAPTSRGFFRWLASILGPGD